MKNQIISFLKNHKIKSGIFLLVAVVVLSWLFVNRQSSSNQTFDVKKTNLQKNIGISGKVVPAQDVDLGFERGGTVLGVYKHIGEKVKKGDVIAELESSDIVASRDMAYADLLAAQAELVRIKGNVEESNDITSNREQVINAIVDAYTKANDAVYNKVDQFFENPRTGPEIRYTFFDYFATKDKINNERAYLEGTLNDFADLALNLNSDNYTNEKLKQAKVYIQKVKSFLDLVSFAVNSFEESYSLSQTTIDRYKTDVLNARTSINTVLGDIVSYESKLRSAVADADIQEARVKSKEATVRSYNAQIAKGIIYAPFDGILSLEEAKVGESVAQNVTVARVMSDGYQIEAYIPEINIQGIALGNSASVKLDAYGDEEFEAAIVHIDPAETMRDGVANYKIKLAFTKSDARILSGMTADIQILTDNIPNVLVIPERSVLNDEGSDTYVLKKTKDDPIKTKVTLGRKDGKGNVEVVAGLQEGDSIILNP